MAKRQSARTPRVRLAQVCFVSVAAVTFVSILAVHASAAFDPPIVSNKPSDLSSDTLATVTLPPLVRFGPLEANPTPISTSVPTAKLTIPTDSVSPSPASSPEDRVQACMDRCIDLHMSNAQAKANCMQSCLKQRVVPTATATAAQPASGDNKDGNQVSDKSAGRGNDIWLGMLVVVLGVAVGGLAHL